MITTYINTQPFPLHACAHRQTYRKTDTLRGDKTNPGTVNPLYNPGHTPDCERASTTEKHNPGGYV